MLVLDSTEQQVLSALLSRGIPFARAELAVRSASESGEGQSFDGMLRIAYAEAIAGIDRKNA